MGVKFSPKRGGDLDDYWRPLLTQTLNKALADDPHPFVLNLASDEYSSAVDFKALDWPVVSPAFHEVKDGKPRSLFMFTKRARGMMARYAIEKRVEDLTKLKLFSVGGYKFDPEASDDGRWVFARPQPPPVAALRKAAAKG
jgi:uncharacterized protein